MKKLLVISTLALALMQPAAAQENLRPLLAKSLDRLTQVEQRIFEDNSHWRKTLNAAGEVNVVLQRLNRKVNSADLEALQTELEELLRGRPSETAANQVLALLDRAQAEIERLAQ